jgi:hypothetical protein
LGETVGICHRSFSDESAILLPEDGFIEFAGCSFAFVRKGSSRCMVRIALFLYIFREDSAKCLLEPDCSDCTVRPVYCMKCLM